MVVGIAGLSFLVGVSHWLSGIEQSLPDVDALQEHAGTMPELPSDDVLQAFLARDDTEFLDDDSAGFPWLSPNRCSFDCRLVQALVAHDERAKLAASDPFVANLLARRINSGLRSEEVMRMYLRHVDLGHGIFGLERGARFYFQHSAMELTVDEAATLAAVQSSPKRYDPLIFPISLHFQRHAILSAMQQRGWSRPVAALEH